RASPPGALSSCFWPSAASGRSGRASQGASIRCLPELASVAHGLTVDDAGVRAGELEPISKSPEEDNEAGELNKAQENSGYGTPSGRGFGAATGSKQRSAKRASGAYSGLDGVDLA